MGAWHIDGVQLRRLAYASLAILLAAGVPLLVRTSWRGTAELHTLIETVATLLAIITGAMALVRYYSKTDLTFLLLGNGLLGAGLLDGFHAAVTSSFLIGRTPSALAALTHWSGTTSRVFLSLLLCASLLGWK